MQFSGQYTARSHGEMKMLPRHDLDKPNERYFSTYLPPRTKQPCSYPPPPPSPPCPCMLKAQSAATTSSSLLLPAAAAVAALSVSMSMSMLKSIICCSSNGSIREWSVAHEVKNTRFLAQMWEHNGFITDVVSRPGRLRLHIYVPTDFNSGSVGSCVNRVFHAINTALVNSMAGLGLQLYIRACRENPTYLPSPSVASAGNAGI